MTQRSPWAVALEYHRKRRGFTQDSLASALRTVQSTICDYERGGLLPPLQLLSELCDVLELTGADRSAFVEEAYLAHSHDRVRALVMDLRQRYAKLERIARLKGYDLT